MIKNASLYRTPVRFPTFRILLALAALIALLVTRVAKGEDFPHGAHPAIASVPDAAHSDCPP
jgi:hypothetical protein